jgi:coenzyme F420-reducing hydrogenase gamma subunit
MAKLKVAVYKFTSCAGCQLEFLHCEGELLEMTKQIEFAYFKEAKRDWIPGPYDIGFVEGAVSTAEAEKQIKKVREDCRILVVMGACATTGGLPSLKNWLDVEKIKKKIYPRPGLIQTSPTAKAVHDYVKVDYWLQGCPIDRSELLEFILSVIAGRNPNLRPHSVCVECKLKGNKCLYVTDRLPCMGSVTRAGCGAMHPSNNRVCIGCRGPCDDANALSLACMFETELKMPPRDIILHFRKFAGDMPLFKAVEEKHKNIKSKSNSKKAKS